MLIGIKGPLGSGKTSVLTFVGLRQYAVGLNVYSNYGLNFRPGPTCGEVLPFSSENLANGEWQGPGILLIDELPVWMDSRASISNRLSSQMVLQTRKKKTHIAYTTQFLDQVDLRVRRLTDVVIECEKRKDFAHLRIVRTYDGHEVEKKLYLPPLYDLFDTNEIIKKPQQKVEVKKTEPVPIIKPSRKDIPL